MNGVRKFVLIGAAFLALVPAAAQAQQKIHVNIGGGPAFLGGDLATRFELGYGPAFGVTFDITKRAGFQFEYGYRQFGLKDGVLPPGASSFSATHRTHQLDFNITMNLTKEGAKNRVYLVGGPGAYNRSVEITQYVGNGVICDPFWYVCGTYPIEDVIGSRGGWDFGYNVGGGVGFGIGETAEFYIEMRYHHVTGPEIVSSTPLPPTTVTASQGGSTNGSYLPLTFGFRF